MTKLKTQNFFSGTATETIPSSGAFDVSLSATPTETKWYIVFDYLTASREVVYFYNRVGSRIYVSAEWRTSPIAHSIGATAQINNVAEFSNYLSDISSTLGYVEKVWGLNIVVWGGTIFVNESVASVSDTSLTLPASQTNYIYLEIATSTIKQTINSAVYLADGILLATVISTASQATTVTYNRPALVYMKGVDGTTIEYDANGKLHAVLTTGATWPTWPAGATGATGATWPTWPTGATWPQWATWPAGSGAGDMLKSENLAFLPSYPTARTNLWLGTLATQNGTFSGTSSGTNTGDDPTKVYTWMFGRSAVWVGNEVVTWVWFLPKSVRILSFIQANVRVSSDGTSGSIGVAKTLQSSRNIAGDLWNFPETTAIVAVNDYFGWTNENIATLSALGSDGFTLNFTKNDGNLTCIYTCIG